MATIKDLIGKGPDELEKMSDEELRKWCEPYLRIAEVTTTKIEVNEQGEIDLEDEPNEPPKPRKKASKEDMIKEMMKLAQLHGVDMSNFKTPIK